MFPIEGHPAVISDGEISSDQTIRYIQIRRGVNIYLITYSPLMDLTSPAALLKGTVQRDFNYVF